MSRFWTTIIISLSIIVIATLSFFLYKNTQELENYKKRISESLTNYMKLQQKYEDLSKSKELRQMIVFTNASDSDSKNIQIADIINEYAKKIDGDLSIFYKNLTTDESVVVEGDKKYYMASLYKVILGLFLLGEVEKGNIALDSPVGTSSATLSTMLEKIITESNNEYSEQLGDEFGWKKIEVEVKEKLGIEFSLGKDLEISVENIGILFRNIALARNIRDSERDYMLRLLKDQKIRNKLPKYLPASVRAHNKTGELDNYSHDAGIFYTPKANYILVFMSKTEDTDDTNEQMALMSKEIYEELNL